MGRIAVDQIRPDGSVIEDVDTTLTETEKKGLLLDALPGSRSELYAGTRVIRYRNQVILRAQVTHLGRPWPGFKKRIQIPRSWLTVVKQAEMDGLTARFIGIYSYGDVTIFVDFDPSTYVRRKANNSAAHVATNDLFQAQTLGVFSRQDRRGNRLTSVRPEELAGYLKGEGDLTESHPHLDIIDGFSASFLDGRRIEALDAVQEMYEVDWTDAFLNEWAGFYLEYRFHDHLERHRHFDLMDVQVGPKKMKRWDEEVHRYDYDLLLLRNGEIEHYGDLKSSNIAVNDSPGNDARNFHSVLKDYGRFWYVIYEHETWHGRDNGDVATIAWNEWRRSVGHVQRGTYSPLSYAGRFKEAVRFVRVRVLEVNAANRHIVLGDFQEGFRQPDGSPRKGKVMIKKKDIDNFLIYTRTILA